MRTMREKSPPMPPGHPGEKVTLLRKRLGLTQTELADTAHLSQRTVTALEQGRDVALPTLTALATALNVTVVELLTPLP
jgi:transcriptional regulator with XRE-family HTH domain